MSLWDWAGAAYGRPGVAEACLELQDAHGQNVSLLLWAAWARAGDAALVTLAARTAREWDRIALTSLRRARRALKAPAPPVPDAAREGLREMVEAAELQGERVLLETLEALTGAAGDRAELLAALRAASGAWGRAAPAPSLARLAGLLA